MDIKSCLKLTTTATGTLKMLETVYINEAVSRVHVSEWFKRLTEEIEDLFEIQNSYKNL